MRRTKKWWAALTQEERRELSAIEASMAWSTPYFGTLCRVCAEPSRSVICSACSGHRTRLIQKADAVSTRNSGV